MERLVLHQNETAAIADLVAHALGDNQPWEPVRFARRAAAVAQLLPVRLRQFLTQVRSAEADVAVLSGLPIDPDLPPTPGGWEAAAKTGAGQAEELLLMLCGTVLGEPFAWTHQQAGRLVHDVVPAPGEELSATSASSQAALSLHTEDSHHSCRGDYVALLCLRNPDAVGTTFVRVDKLDLPERTREILSDDRYRFNADDSHVGTTAFGAGADIGSILFGPSDRPYLRIDLDFTYPVVDDSETEAAVRTMTTLLQNGRERYILQPGDALFIDNYQVVHGREPFSPRYDGKDRWLKRVNLTRDLRRAYVTTRSRSPILP